MKALFKAPNDKKRLALKLNGTGLPVLDCPFSTDGAYKPDGRSPSGLEATGNRRAAIFEGSAAAHFRVDAVNELELGYFYRKPPSAIPPYLGYGYGVFRSP